MTHTTKEKLEKLISEKFPGCHFVIDGSGTKLQGKISWDGFEGISFENRTKIINDSIKYPLGYHSVNVGDLIPLAPKEKL